MSQPCDQATWLSFLTYGWLNPLVDTGVQRQINEADIPELAESEDTTANTKTLIVNLDAEEQDGKSHPLIRAVVATYWNQLLLLEFLQIASYLLGLLSPLLLQQVLIFQEAQSGTEVTKLSSQQVSRGMAAISTYIALGLFMIFYGSQMSFFQARLTLRIGSALRGCVFQRCIKEREQAATRATGNNSNGDAQESTPTVYNVISFDVGPNIDIIWIVLAVWLFPIQLISALAVLFAQVKWAVVPGLAVVIVAKAINMVLLVSDGYLRHTQLKAKDERLGRCNEGFNGIRTLQMLAWTQPFLDGIMDARAEELRAQRLRLWMQKMPAALDYGLSTMVTLAIMSYYVLHEGKELKASTVLPVISLATSLVGPFGQFPTWANQYLIWKSAYVRVNAYMGVDSSGGRPRQGPAFDSLPGSPPSAAVSPIVSLRACTLTWGTTAEADGDDGGDAAEGAESSPLIVDQQFSLKDIDLEINAGDQLILCGQSGHGKTSLLLGLLGEVSVAAGSLRSPSTARLRAEHAAAALPGSMQEAREEAASGAAGGVLLDAHGVAYASQTVTLFTGTVRSNILFGLKYDAGLYTQVLKACSLETDLASMIAGDLSEVAQGGATLSGGQRARLGLARAAYRAALARRGRPGSSPLVLLDDPFCALDRKVAAEICQALFAPPAGILIGCAVVVAAADPWWLGCLPLDRANLKVAILREGRILALDTPSKVLEQGFHELQKVSVEAGGRGMGGSSSSGTGSAGMAMPMLASAPSGSNPQDDEMEEAAPSPPALPQSKLSEAATQTMPSEAEAKKGGLLVQEHREAGNVKGSTYLAYLWAVGPLMLTILCAALTSIMVFQNLCTLWITYWTAEDKTNTFMWPWLKLFYTTPPEQPKQLLTVYAWLVAGFVASNFAGHSFEILGGVRAAHSLFGEALVGTLSRPFRWWDANPTGRVLNRFSEDVEVMDLAVTNILGVIFGAVLYFIGHALVLAISNPITLALLPFVAYGMEIYAVYYRMTIREIQRMYLVSMSTVYQDMVEAIIGKVTIRAFGSSRQVLCSNTEALDTFQRVSFAKTCVSLWIGLRMSLIGYTLSTYTSLQPVLQYFGLVSAQSAAIVGFSITYSQGIIGIIQQLITNYSDLEMQLISIERLREYAEGEAVQPPALALEPSWRQGPGGLVMQAVEVIYRSGLPPALTDVNLSFNEGEAAAIMGRTGAGKTSLLLSVLQLVPYTGEIIVGGRRLADLAPEVVRANLVGVVPQQPLIFSGNLRKNLDPLDLRSDDELWRVIEAVGLRGICASDGRDLNSGCGDGKLALSQGQQQLLCAARVLLRSPRVVLLDEVTASLPPEVAMSTLTTLLNRFKDTRASVLLVTHQEELLPVCDRVVCVAAGRIIGDESIAAGGLATTAA